MQSLAQEQQSEYKTFYYPNGNISSEGILVNNKPDAYWKTYYENGNLKSEGNRLNFELDSLWKFYDEEGNIQLEINYKNGRKQGRRISYLPEEIVHDNFAADIKHGFSFVYSLNGKLLRKTPFVNGLEDGMAFSYDSLGTIIELASYKKGYIIGRERINRYDTELREHGPWKWFFDDGKIKADGHFKHGLRNGIFRSYSVEGDLLKIEKYIDGIRQDDAEELARLEIQRDYYPDGKVKVEATYRKGLAEGIRREFDEDGNVVKAYIFKDGKIMAEGIITTDGLRQGFWEERYPNGNIKASGNYVDGLRNGKWEFFYPDGKIEQSGNYNEKGEAENKWVWYYNSGELMREETYRKGVRDGLLTEFDQNEKVIAQGDFIDGKEEGFWRVITNDFVEEGDFVEGMRQGKWKHFYADGGLAFEGQFIENQPNGKHIFYYPNGKKSEEGSYLMGRKNGEWKKWDEDGSLFLVVLYVNGIEQSYDGIPIPDEEIIFDIE